VTAKPPEELDQLQAMRILVVEDSKYMRTLLRGLLQSYGVREVLEAGDGSEALKIVMASPPDAIVCDLQMMPMNGLEFVDLVRKAENSPNRFMPIVMITANPSRETVAAARDAGVSEFLAKPVTAEALLSRLLAAIKPRPFVETRKFFGPDRRRKDDPKYPGPERRETEPEDVDVDLPAKPKPPKSS